MNTSGTSKYREALYFDLPVSRPRCFVWTFHTSHATGLDTPYGHKYF